jgi:hypothetical protein
MELKSKIVGEEHEPNCRIHKEPVKEGHMGEQITISEAGPFTGSK